MKNLKITKGEWIARKPTNSNGWMYINNQDNDSGAIATCYHTYDDNINGTNEVEANAQLITDTFNTANKCGKLPSELLAERDELIKVLEVVLRDVEWFDYSPTKNLIEKAINNKTLSK